MTLHSKFGRKESRKKSWKIHSWNQRPQEWYFSEKEEERKGNGLTEKGKSGAK
jgi:hypothetical protein